MIIAACAPLATPSLALKNSRYPALTAQSEAANLTLDQQLANRATSTADQPLLVWLPGLGETWLRSVDPASGQDATGKPPLLLGSAQDGPAISRLSPDGERIAITFGDSSICEPYAGGSRCMAAHQFLSLVDVPSWQQNEIELPGSGWASAMAFSPDSSRLALVYHQPDRDLLLLYAAANNALLASRELPFPAEWMAYALGGNQIAIVGSNPGEQPGISQPESAQFLLLDSASLEPAWQQTLESVQSGQWCLTHCDGAPEEILFAYFQPGISLSPGGEHLYIVPAGEETITHLDLSAQTSQTIPIQPVQTWLERLLSITAGRALAKTMPQGAIRLAAVSPDGRTLYIATQRLSPEAQDQSAATLQAVDLASGEQISQAESQATSWISQLISLPDREQLLLVGYDQDSARAEIYTPLLKLAAELDGWQIRASRAAAGAPLLLGSDQRDRRTNLGKVDDFYEIPAAWFIDGLAEWVTDSEG
jgi:hypothetical protein